MIDEKETIVSNEENPDDINNIIEEANEEQTNEINPIPLDKIIVGIVEKPILKMIDDEEKRKEFLINYESQCLPILEAINFNEVLQRKLFMGKELTDNQIIAIGFGTIAVTAFLNVLPYLKKKKKKVKENEQNNKQEIKGNLQG